AFGVGPQTLRVDWTAGADAKDVPDAISQAKLMSQQALGGDVGQITDWGLFMVGPAAEGMRTNASIKKAKFLADVQFAGSDKITRVESICTDVRMITYAGYSLGGYA